MGVTYFRAPAIRVNVVERGSETKTYCYYCHYILSMLSFSSNEWIQWSEKTFPPTNHYTTLSESIFN